MFKDISCDGRFTRARFSIDEYVRTSITPQGWSQYKSKFSYLILPMREGLRDIIVSKAFSILEDGRALNISIEYA